MQVYRGMDIGTAKPSSEVRKVLTHHLIDIKEPTEQFSSGEFIKRAEELIPEIRQRGKIPVLSGGTAFYFKNFLCGLSQAPPSDLEIRTELKSEFNKKGPSALYTELKALDAQSASRIHPNDTYRILRALEVIRLTGIPLSRYMVPSEIRAGSSLFIAGLTRPRVELYNRINARVDKMFEEGLSDEIRILLARGFRQEDPGMRGLGYKEFFEFLSRGCGTKLEVAENIKRNSRNYAKRQITFFNSLPGVRWYNPEEDLLERDLEEFLSS